MGVKVTNNGFGTISAGINSSATTVVLDSGQGARFPTLASGDFFFGTLVDTSNNIEIVKVTARSSDSMTVTRAQDNTSARAFSVGDRFELRPTAALFENAHLDNTPTSTGSLGLPKGTTAQQPTASATEGHIRYDTDDDVVYYSNGTNWLKISSAVPNLTSVSGNIINGIVTNLTLAGTNFLASNLVVSFTPSGGSASTVTVTPSSTTAATVAVPAAIYGQSASTVIAIKVTNSDGVESSSVNSTVLSAPTGGSISNAGGYRIHTFNSSANFVVPSGLTLSNVEYLIIAGGGGANFGGTSGQSGGGAGAGGYRSSVTGENSGGGANAESKMTLSAGTYGAVVGAGGAGQAAATVAPNGSNSTFNSITSLGGGGSARQDPGSNAGSGGSGGGRGSGGGGSGVSGAGTSGQGFDAGENDKNPTYNGGGGGGAGGAGQHGGSQGNGRGGVGVSSSITGSSVDRAGGGSAGYRSSSSNVTSIGFGGGAGAADFSSTGGNGSANTGGGGGGGGATNAGGSGGSGVIIVRYQI